MLSQLDSHFIKNSFISTNVWAGKIMYNLLDRNCTNTKESTYLEYHVFYSDSEKTLQLLLLLLLSLLLLLLLQLLLLFLHYIFYYFNEKQIRLWPKYIACGKKFNFICSRNFKRPSFTKLGSKFTSYLVTRILFFFY